MHPTKRVRRGAWWGAVLAGLVAVAPMTAQEVPTRPAPAATVDRSGAVLVPLNGTIRLQMKSGKRIREVYNSIPNVIDVLPDAADPRSVILFGRAVGATRLELTDVDTKKEEYTVVVQPDIELLRTLLKRAVPTAAIEAIPGLGGNIILTGNVPKAEDVDTILRIAATVSGNVVNGMQVGGVHQVQLDVVVARVDRTKARNRGVSFGVAGKTVTFSSILGGLASLPATQSAGGTSQTLGGIQPTGTGNITIGVIPANFLAAIQALKTEGLAKLLAEPKLVTQSGRPARFLAGGQQATLGPSSGINGPGVTYVDVGTELEFLPIVYGNGRIYLEVQPRVRGVNQSLGITTSFGAVPGFDEQTVRTSVVMESGQTFAIGGLIQTTTQNSVAKVPILGEIPFVGAIFSSINVSEQESELVILVTPHLIDPMDCRQVPGRLPGAETRKPDDFEVYLESLLEAPRGPRRVFEGAHYRGAWTNDPTAGEFPCAGAGIYGIGSGNGCGNGVCAPPHAGAADLDAPAAGPRPLPPIMDAAPPGTALPPPVGR